MIIVIHITVLHHGNHSQMETNRLKLVLLLTFLLSAICKPVAALSLSRKVDSIQIVFDAEQLVLPGESFRIGIVSHEKNGKVKYTAGLLGGSVWWMKYKIDVIGGTDFGGRIWVNDQLVPSRGKYIGIKAYPRKQPELIKELLLPLNFETNIVYRPTNNFDKAPGSQIRGELVTEFNNGMRRVCENLRNSRESEYFHFSTHGGSWKNGKFTIDPDFTQIKEHRSALIVSSLRNQSIADTFSVLLDYRHTYDLHLSGSSGFPGFSGSSGSSGTSGSNGYDGEDGQNGEYGSDGPDLGIWVDLYHDSILNCDLLYVYAQNLWTGEESRYLINPDGGKLSVSSAGGSGGSGGSGGNGGAGGQGLEGEKWMEKHIEQKIVKKPVIKKVLRKEKKKVIDAEGKEVEVEVDVEVNETVYVDEIIEVEVEVPMQGPGGDGGDGGWGGAGGLGAPGGYGGNINLYFTDDAWKYQYVIVASSRGGSGGMNGSGGNGGSGGSGGSGNPNGRNGSGGRSGPSAMGWAGSGGSGKIMIKPTDEFFFYLPNGQASEMESQ